MYFCILYLILNFTKHCIQLVQSNNTVVLSYYSWQTGIPCLRRRSMERTAVQRHLCAVSHSRSSDQRLKTFFISSLIPHTTKILGGPWRTRPTVQRPPPCLCRTAKCFLIIVTTEGFNVAEITKLFQGPQQ